MQAQRDAGSRHPILLSLTAAVLASGVLAISLLLAMAPTHAGEHVYDITNKTYKGECSACHIAYPPQLLPAQSWRTIMAGLGKHFGSDASIDAGAAEELRRYLEQNAGRRRGLEGTPAQGPGAGATPRISTTDWFVKEHRKVATDFRSNKNVGSAANCAACHTRADQGDFSERSLRIPR
jgi:cytochrome c553